MNETEKLIAEIAARLLVASIEQGIGTRDSAYAYQCVNLAKIVVNGAQAK